jgi:DNA polymerase
VAAQSLLGSGFKVTQSHGKVQHHEGLPPVIATLHPSAILRARTPEDRDRDTNVFLDDLRQAGTFLNRRPHSMPYPSR